MGYPEFRVWAVGQLTSGKAAKVLLRVPLCDAHLERGGSGIGKLHSWLTDDLKDALRVAVRRNIEHAIPLWTTLTVRRQPIPASDYAVHKALQSGEKVSIKMVAG